MVKQYVREWFRENSMISDKERRETEMAKEAKAYIVRCPICGKEICSCIGVSHIDIKCGSCKTPFSIVRNEDSLMLKEGESAGYRTK